MNTIIYLKDIPVMKKIFGILISSASLYLILTGAIFFGFIFLAIGINLILTEGSEINLDNKTYRNIKSIFGVNFGKWKNCPQFEYISIFKTKENKTITVVTATATLTNEVLLINLFYDRNKHQTFYKTDNKEDAFKVAAHFKLALNIDILDATEKESKWL